jgi:SAM-dependent methyltransferase
MHPTAMSNADAFFKNYSPNLPKKSRVLEIGSQDVNGSIRTVCPKEYEYTGIDFVEGKGVDIVINDPYAFPFKDNEADIIISSSCFEHSEFFWLVFLEIMRCLKPHGLFYMNAPSTGTFHRYPVDCWRFYPDSAAALANWGKRNGFNCAVLESYIQVNCQFRDFVGVFIKDAAHAPTYPRKIIDRKIDFENGIQFGQNAFRNPGWMVENELRLRAIADIASGRVQVRPTP